MTRENAGRGVYGEAFMQVSSFLYCAPPRRAPNLQTSSQTRKPLTSPPPIVNMSRGVSHYYMDLII